jgi:type I restriction enzyme S subunit
MDILNNRYITYDKIIAFVEPKGNDLKEFGVNYGDVLFQRSSETLEDVGRANVYLDKKTALFGGFVIRGKKTGEYNPLFFRYLLSSSHVRKRIVVKGAGAQHFNIGQDGLSKVFIFVPTIKEQERIAQLLDLIDERIETQIRIISEMQSLISGITQRISKHSSIRMVLLSELLVERNEKNAELFPVHSVSVSEGVVNQIDYLGRSFSATDTSHYNVAHRGDIIYTKSPTGEFPFGIVKRNSIETNVSVSPLYGVYKPVSDDVAIYLHYYFCSPLNAQNYLHKLIQKGAKNTINITNQRFLENRIPLPNKKTLVGFVKLISAVSAKYKLEKSLLETLYRQKRYLLTQMFV